ncbi:MAG: T9SS type A sorting domain-containing protein [Bacteroidia bacterium]|nr:T9SS type A sorting domain-containing protein [Bacteroidia bacterium]
MKKTINYLIALLLISTGKQTFSQTYPSFGNEIPVTINGLTFDAMEPSISADGNYMFFNSLNNGTTTSLYYATKVNDSTFNYVGPLSGANQITTPRLDAVASSDSADNFFWVSTRNYPTQMDNFFHGKFNGSNVVNTGRLHGTFYIYIPGWLIMDAAINYQGTLLYFCNAYFNGCGAIPCQAKLGVAQKQNDSTFNKLINSDGIMQNVNDTNYIVYAPAVTTDGLELYYTRILKTNLTQSEICVSVRSAATDTFSLPFVMYVSNQIPEAPTLTTDQSKMYYHKNVAGTFKLFLRYRTSFAGINEKEKIDVRVFPNPSGNLVNIELTGVEKNYFVEIYSAQGKLILKANCKTSVDVSELESGIYTIIVRNENMIRKGKFIKLQ